MHLRGYVLSDRLNIFAAGEHNFDDNLFSASCFLELFGKFSTGVCWMMKFGSENVLLNLRGTMVGWGHSASHTGGKDVLSYAFVEIYR